MSYYTATPIQCQENDLTQRYRIDWPSGTMERTFTDELHKIRWLKCMNDSAATDQQASASYRCL